MWGYKQDGVIVAVNPNNMSGNSGWEKVPGGTMPVQAPKELYKDKGAAINAKYAAMQKEKPRTDAQRISRIEEMLGIRE
jgi:hypothetical protein